MKSIAILGPTGQVGRELLALAPSSAEFRFIAIDRRAADLATPGAAAAAIRRMKPHAVINAAAWTAVDKAESEADAAYRINGEAVGEIAEATSSIGARLIHLSTDYVFAGDGSSPIGETADCQPLSVYGASKLKGEELALRRDPAVIILRTSWVFSPFGGNFLKTMLRLSETKSSISVVADQHGGPTSARSIAAACMKILNSGRPGAGLYHFQGAPAATWAGFAEEIFRAADKAVQVQKIPTSAYPTPARRPAYTVLNCTRILRDFGVGQPDWRLDVAGTIARLNTAKAAGE
jgi:dTDP-4-dehydrorhamnose reductase